MYPTTKHDEFLRLRVQGVSLASIGRRLGISKPTIIKWQRKFHAEIIAAAETERQRTREALAIPDEIAGLNRKLAALKQELLSRALRDTPTAHLETLAGQIQQRLDSLKPSPEDVRTQSNPIEPEKNNCPHENSVNSVN